MPSGPFLWTETFISGRTGRSIPYDPGSDLRSGRTPGRASFRPQGSRRSPGGKLGLSPAGRKALDKPVQEGIRTAWNKWVRQQAVRRVRAHRGDQGQAGRRLSAVADRRQAISGVLEDCPPGRWIAIDEFFRFLRAQGADFSIARNDWKLYIAELQYGSFGYAGDIRGSCSRADSSWRCCSSMPRRWV